MTSKKQTIELDITKIRKLIIKFLDLFDNPRDLKLFENFVIIQAHIKNNHLKVLEKELEKTLEEEILDNYKKTEKTNINENFLYIQYILFKYPKKMNLFFKNLNNILNNNIEDKESNNLYRINHLKPKNIDTIAILTTNDIDIISDRLKIKYWFESDFKNKKIQSFFNSDLNYFTLLFKEELIFETSHKKDSKYISCFYNNILKSKFDNKINLIEIFLDLFIELFNYGSFKDHNINYYYKHLSLENEKEIDCSFFNEDSVNTNKLRHFLKELFYDIYDKTRIDSSNQDKFYQVNIVLRPFISAFKVNSILDIYFNNNFNKIFKEYNKDKHKDLNPIIEFSLLNVSYMKNEEINLNYLKNINHKYKIADLKEIFLDTINTIKRDEKSENTNQVIIKCNYQVLNTVLLMMSYKEKNPSEFIENYKKELIKKNQVGTSSFDKLVKDITNVSFDKDISLNYLIKKFEYLYKLLKKIKFNNIYQKELYKIFFDSRFDNTELEKQFKYLDEELHFEKQRIDGELEYAITTSYDNPEIHKIRLEFLELFQQEEYRNKLIEMSINTDYNSIMNNAYDNLPIKFILEGNLDRNVPLFNLENKEKIEDFFNNLK